MIYFCVLKEITKPKKIIAIVLIVFLAFLAKYTSIEKVGDSIPSVSDLENELVERNLYTDEYLLFGVDNIGNNVHKIDSNTLDNYANNL